MPKKYFEKSTINIVVVWNKPKTKKHDAGDGNLFVLFHMSIYICYISYYFDLLYFVIVMIELIRKTNNMKESQKSKFDQNVFLFFFYAKITKINN
jgi:hypothetical protein